MTSLYVDRRGIELKLEDEAIVFYENNSRIGTVPIAPLERIYIRGNVLVTSGVLGRLGRSGIGVIILSGRRAEPTIFLPRPHNDATIRLGQFRMALDNRHRLTFARWIIKEKLKCQRDFMRQLAEARQAKRKTLLDAANSLDKMVGYVGLKADLAALRGLEGAGAAAYFLAFQAILPPEAGFAGRNRRPPRDPANALMSLSYTMLHAEAVLACHGHGFDPNVGFLHDLDYGRESLACDLVEPLRVEMDRFVYRAFATQLMRARDFSTEKDGACLLGKAGRTRFYAEIEKPLTACRKRLNEILTALREYVLDDGNEGALSDRV